MDLHFEIGNNLVVDDEVHKWNLAKQFIQREDSTDQFLKHGFAF